MSEVWDLPRMLSTIAGIYLTLLFIVMVTTLVSPKGQTSSHRKATATLMAAVLVLSALGIAFIGGIKALGAALLVPVTLLAGIIALLIVIAILVGVAMLVKAIHETLAKFYERRENQAQP